MEQKKVILSLQNLVVKFRVRSRVLTSIRNVSFDIYDGETIAIVGESGSGKSVLTKTLTNMLESNGYVANGSVFYYPSANSKTASYFSEPLDLIKFHKGAMEPESRKGIRKYNHRQIALARKQIAAYSKLTPELLSLKQAALTAKIDKLGDFEFNAHTKKNRQKDKLEAQNKVLAKHRDLLQDSALMQKAIGELEAQIAQAQQEIVNFKLFSWDKKAIYALTMAVLSNVHDIHHGVLEVEQVLAYNPSQHPQAERLLTWTLKRLQKQKYKNEFEDALTNVLDKTLAKQPLSHAEMEVAQELWQYYRKPGTVLRQQARKNLTHLRGGTIATIFQDPMTSLNPLLSVGYQISEVLRLHHGLNLAEAKAEAVKLMQKVGIPNAENRYHDLPGKYSGGMRQRIVIAVALAARPKILICDEPTTALDVTIQAQILELIRNLKKEYGFTVIFITHDLGVVANIADRIAVVYAGQIIEYGTTEDIFFNSQHPYTWALLSSLPQLGDKGHELYSIPGSPPSLFNEIKGDAFAPRNEFALAVDYVHEPPFFKVSETHGAKTWLLDERAPKVKRPAILESLRSAIEAAQVGGDQ